ncbi:89b280d9-87b2-4c8a-96ab-524d756244b3 [Thermothielavioides terrestris]|uniref:89b280d9-87b2-4c8a-96ab-524d756244b3 n=1 Tax=Thermothielavioides terrestris TaxID=2587410 RepID=A0A446BGW0_9PEZI|nr:89b280d9-87b2-4c8a-96ab-524d756244b3 [Thermothielavioides terrestris]
MASGLEDVKEALKAISLGQTKLLSAVEAVSQRVAEFEKSRDEEHRRPSGSVADGVKRTTTPLAGGFTPSPASVMPPEAGTQTPPPSSASPDFKSSFSSRVVLTTYPKQIGIKPLPMEWGAADPLERGPVTVSRSPSTIGRRNAIGAHGGSYSIYYALALASRELKADHRPDFTNTEPAVNIGPFPQWADKKKIVAMDPWGHLVPWLYKDIIQKENGMFTVPAPFTCCC